MPKGKKVCPKCSAEVGVRTSVCKCGHEFRTLAAVPASSEPMTLEGRIEATVAERPKDTSPPAQKEPERKSKSAFSVATTGGFRGSAIYTPAGACPVKPNGYKVDGDWSPSDQDIEEWAFAVHQWGINSGFTYLPQAVVYFARQFWDINSKEFERVRALVIKTLTPQEPEHEPAVDGGDGGAD